MHSKICHKKYITHNNIFCWWIYNLIQINFTCLLYDITYQKQKEEKSHHTQITIKHLERQSMNNWKMTISLKILMKNKTMVKKLEHRQKKAIYPL